jgi:hypothetical protein
MSDKKEPSPETVQEIIYYYSNKKRLHTKSGNYTYLHTETGDKYMREAALLCEELQLTPASYIQLIYDDMGPGQKHFSPQHLRGTAVEHFFRDRQNTNGSFSIELTRENIPYDDIWDHMYELCMRQLRLGRSLEEVLMDSSMKLYAWFRILASPQEIPAVVQKYKHICRKEMNDKLLKYIKEAGLDVHRVLN